MSAFDHSRAMPRSAELSAALASRLLNDFQDNFPLCPAPFAELAARLGVAEAAVLRQLEQFRREGKIARVGAVFSPKRVGASTLVAMAVPADKLARIAEAVSRFPEVNHRDEREHEYNLWFVVTAGSEGRLQAALGAIEQATGYPLLRLPLLKKFQIAAGGSGSGQPSPQEVTPALVETETICPSTVLDEIGRRLVMALQEGLPLFIRPFSVLAARVGCEEDEVLERIRQWRAQGVIKRFGLVVPKPVAEVGLSALLVLDIPDEEIARMGELLARETGIPFCYQRPRVLPAWPYNLFCLLNGQLKDEIRDVLRAKVAELRQRLGLTDCAYDILYSVRPVVRL